MSDQKQLFESTTESDYKSITYPDCESIVNLYTEGIYVMYKNKGEGEKDRSSKGKLTESILEAIVSLAWYEIDGKGNRLNIERQLLKIPIDADDLSRKVSGKPQARFTTHPTPFIPPQAGG